MSKYVRIVGIAAICGAALVSSGCMGLSLFSSTHTHHHEGADLQTRVEALEYRLDAAEKDSAGEAAN